MSDQILDEGDKRGAGGCVGEQWLQLRSKVNRRHRQQCGRDLAEGAHPLVVGGIADQLVADRTLLWVVAAQDAQDGDSHIGPRVRVVGDAEPDLGAESVPEGLGVLAEDVECA